MHNIDKGLPGGVFGEVIGESGPILVGGDLFNPRNNFVRNQVSVGLYMDVGMGWQIWE